MLKIGQNNTLTVIRIVDFGAYLDGGDGIEILLPARYITTPLAAGDRLDVFVYTDSEDRLIATTEIPLARVGEFAWLEVVAVNRVGAFLDWGLMKDLLVPYREQKVRMEVGRRYLVYVYLDDASQRVVGSAKVEKFIGNVLPDYEPGDKVCAKVYKHTPVGWACIVENLYHGMLYDNELYKAVSSGDEVEVYIKCQRPDGKLDLTLSGSMFNRVSALSHKIISKLKVAGGTIPLGDNSTPEEIMAAFGCSKKDFKKAIGYLLKKSLIDKNTDRLTLLAEK